jgi:hypothetical protein
LDEVGGDDQPRPRRYKPTISSGLPIFLSKILSLMPIGPTFLAVRGIFSDSNDAQALNLDGTTGHDGSGGGRCFGG